MCQARAYSTVMITRAIRTDGCIGLLQKAVEFGFDGRAGRGADDAPVRISFDKAEQSWDGLNVVNETEVEAVVRVDLQQFDFPSAIRREFLEHRIQDLARAAPGSPELH